MHEFRVWAPQAEKVAVRSGDSLWPMEQEARGWWKATVSDAGPGTDYMFVLGDGKPMPDPRSPYQPEGIQGPSRVVDHSTFVWTDKNWNARPLGSAVIYELHIGTFSPQGTFRGAISCLEHLTKLGVTHVELMPVNEFSGHWGWGYDGVDLFAPHHAYGTPDDLKELVNACHERGLAVLLDVVYNHFGPVGNYLNEFGPYFTDAYHTPWGSAVNLDHEGSPEVRRFFLDNALMWLRDYHFDGLRLDAVHAYFDSSAVHFLEELSLEVEDLEAYLGRHLVLIAESDLNDPRLVTAREAGGYGIDAQWSDDFHHALHTVLTEESNGYYADFGALADLAKALQQAFVYDGIHSSHRNRRHGRPPLGLSGHRFLAYSQNHDQIGNRAQGERISQLVSQGKQKIAAALVLCSPFVPMLFQGEEYGAATPFQYFTHHDDPELGEKVSEGRKREFEAFGWKPEDVPDPQAPETFERSKLQWEELSNPDHASMFDWYRKVIQLRRLSPALSNGHMERVEVNYDERAGFLVMTREDMQVICNLGADRQAIPMTGPAAFVMSSHEDYAERPGLLELPGESVAIVSAKAQPSELGLPSAPALTSRSAFAH